MCLQAGVEVCSFVGLFCVSQFFDVVLVLVLLLVLVLVLVVVCCRDRTHSELGPWLEVR